jgi:hypothetical protein
MKLLYIRIHTHTETERVEMNNTDKLSGMAGFQDKEFISGNALV